MRQSRKVDTSGLSHEVVHGHAAPGARQTDGRASILKLSGPQALLGDAHNHLLGQLHHVVVVGIRLICLHRRELRVVPGRDPFIAEDAADLVHTLEAAHHEALQVQLRCDAQCEVHVEGVVVGLEGLGLGTPGLAVQSRRLDLQEALGIQDVAERGCYLRTQPECLPDLRAGDEVQLALAVTLLLVLQAGPLVRERQQGLGKHRPLGDHDGDLALLGALDGSADADDVPSIDILLERGKRLRGDA
mmetsp:Transcript_45048/g.75791  ORF Transcript_45048/g.75791 Transcript_45048/m.75791 type:complete len:245 (-) Transcript_45048:852-1586(-)